MSKLHDLAGIGQSIWLDYIRRAFIHSGELQALINLGVRGMTSNPTIFEKAIAGSHSPDPKQVGEYDAGIERLTRSGKTPLEIYEILAVEDIRSAADLLSPMYQSTHGQDGYVSLEVNPALAHQSDATFAEAKRLWALVDRPNLMVKIPATQAGIPAITQALAAGINVNVTLIFSLKRYRQVMDAFLTGIEQRAHQGKPVDHLASVASFFISRLDTKVDYKLDHLIRDEGSRSALAMSLRGKSAVANARLAYRMFLDVFNSHRFAALKAKGARPQRPLWASTSTKDPAYSDILYVQELIGADTVNTLPQNTLEAFLDHGEVRLSILDEPDNARLVMEKLESLGISIDQVTQELETEGVEAFSKSFISLLASIEAKQTDFLRKRNPVFLQLGSNQPAIALALEQMEEEKILQRIWDKDHTVWKPDPKEISNRLGWLHVHEDIRAHLPKIEAVVHAAQVSGYTHALLLGMGGSSLAPELFAKTFPPDANLPALKLSILDSTDPTAVLAYAQSLDPEKTLYIVSTKSGSTEETLSFFRYYYNQAVEAVGEQNAGEHFIVITDPGSPLVEIARAHDFRATFINDPNIGGRYSALSLFGLVPAAVSGVDIPRLLASAKEMAHMCAPTLPPRDHPAAQLGVALGELAKAGCDKATLILSPEIAAFGDWLEQLIAESTGKDGQGILPVVGDEIGRPDQYDQDRVFIHVRFQNDQTHSAKLVALESAGFPVIRIQLKDLYDLGEQFFLWELATAIAGYRLGIQPFDQPNVEAAKILARQRVSTFKQTGTMSQSPPALDAQGIAVYGNLTATSPADALKKFIGDAHPGDYIALQAFLQPTKDIEAALQVMRHRILHKTHRATTLGFGPRFLHSTGQLHKGDRGNGLFIQFTASDTVDVPIPDQAGYPSSSITFGTLKLAQALGDQQALLEAGRRVLRFHLKGAVVEHILDLSNSIGE